MDSLQERMISLKKDEKTNAKGRRSFWVIERVNDNPYKVNLAGDFGVSTSFNVADWSPYLEDECLVNLRGNSFQQVEDNGDQVVVQDLALKIVKGMQVQVPTLWPSSKHYSCKFLHYLGMNICKDSVVHLIS